MGGRALEQALFFALLLGGLYVLAIRPQRARARAMGQVQATVGIGSSVVTSAGIEGVVTGMTDEVLVLEIAPGVRVRFLRGAVVRVVDPLLQHDADPDAGLDAGPDQPPEQP